MPIFTAIAAGATALATAVGFGAAAAATIGSVAAFAARTLLTIGISKLISKRASTSGAQDAGSRIQLAPATDNKLPVIYGSAFVSGAITDAKISTDNKTMWYVVSIAEHTDTTVGSGYSFANVYYDGKLVTFGTGADSAKVLSLSNTMTDPPEVDDKVKDNIWIYLFTNGSSSGVNTGGQTAITIMSDSEIASDQRWDQGIYTANGQSASMSNVCFAIVKVKYNQDAGTTNLGSLTFQLQNSLTEPGAVILDYLQNTRYGCGIPNSRIDLASLIQLDSYANSMIDYIDSNGNPATQVRYRINGPINTGYDCLTNLQQLVDSCDSWLQYSEISGKWRVVVNRPYTDYTTFNELFLVDDSNLIGGIEVNPTDLNNTYNEMEVQYPNKYIKDQTDFQLLSLWDVDPSLLSPNEPVNRLTIQLPQVNNAVQAKYLGVRRLYQSREELIVNFATDYSGITVEAGDVIRVTNSQYGWDEKLFRVSNVAEEKYGDGSLGARLTAFEYNDTVYTDNPVQDFVPESNTGLSDPNIIGTPDCPTANVDLTGTIAKMTVTATVPTVGQVLYMDFNYGNSNVSADHLLYTSVSAANAQPFAANAVVSIEATDLAQGNYYWSVTAKNNQVGVRSNTCPQSLANWPGPTVTTFDANSNIGGISGNNIQYNTVTSNNLTTTGVSAGSYSLGGGNVTVGLDGRITFIANGTSSSTLTIQEDSLNVVSNVNIINFYGNNVTVANNAGSADVFISSTGEWPYTFIYGYGFGPYNYNSSGPWANAFLYNTTGQTANIAGGIELNANNTPTTYTVTTNDYNPWFQNTATVANGFLANSTSRFYPGNARIQSISTFISGGTWPSFQIESNDGRRGWIIMGATPTPANAQPETQFMFSGSFGVISDSDCTIQVGGGYRLTRTDLAEYGFWVDYSTVQTIDLLANKPMTVYIDFKAQGNMYANNLVVTSMCGVIRNITSGTNVYTMQGQYTCVRPDDPVNNS